MRRYWRSTLLSLAVVGVIVYLCIAHAQEVGVAVAAIPPLAFIGAVALHVATLALRSEAWRLTLASVEGEIMPRRWIHGANAAAFLAGAAQSQTALPARVALLRRLGGERAPRPAQIFMADVPIFALELCAMSALLFAAAVAGLAPWWIAPAAFVLALAVLLAARLAPARFAGRPMVRGLAILSDRRRRGPLVAIVCALSALTAARLWLVLLICGLPHGLGEVAWVLAATGGFGLLPLGPGAPAAATLATVGATQVGAAVAAGLVISASSIAAVLVYALVVACAWLGGRGAGLHRRSRKRAEVRLAAVQFERAEAREAAMARPVEVG